MTYWLVAVPLIALIVGGLLVAIVAVGRESTERP